MKSLLYRKYLHFLKPFKNYKKHRGYIVKQYIIVAAILTASFLPVRLLFYNYVSHNWLGNLGVMSIIAVIIWVLVEKNKLGWFGVYFKNRIRRLVLHKVFWVAVLLTVLNLPFWLFILWEIDKGEFYYIEERNLMMATIIYAQVKNNSTTQSFSDAFFGNETTVPSPVKLLEESNLVEKKPIIQEIIDVGVYPPAEYMMFYGKLNSTERGEQIINLIEEKGDLHFLDSSLSIISFLVNAKFGAWGSHFLTVFVLEEIEAVALLFFYRKAYFKKEGEIWQEIGLYSKLLPRKLKAEHNRARFLKWLRGF